MNADTFGSAGAAVVVRNDNLQSANLLDHVQQLVGSPERLQAMATALKTFAKPNATQDIAETVVKMASGVLNTPEQKGINV
jgi:UDP-N-acetylglucosamine:LPS N-acetylglucosamine transferase